MVYFVFLKYSDIQRNNDRRIKIWSKKIRKNVDLESCASWTNRLHRMSRNNGDHSRE